MEKDSALYQLMDTRMNGIVSDDGKYQAILRKSDIYSGELDRMDLSKEIRLLIDRYVVSVIFQSCLYHCCFQSPITHQHPLLYNLLSLPMVS